MKIETIDFGNQPLFLAPMEDVTDPSFRYMCKKFGADMVYTEFVASEALIRNVEKTFKKLKLLDYERPAGIQIYGHIVESMVESAKIVEEIKPDVIDINFGCPVKKIANRGAGAGMLKDIPKLIKMTEQIVKSVNTPVTVKTRLGWDDDSKCIPELSEQLQDTGIKALTIHGRTRSQMYRGEADWTLIGKIKENPRIKIPIIGNGDVDSPEKAKQMFDNYGVDGIMIGRSTYGRPWIFKEIKHYLQTGEILPELTIREKVDIAREHFEQSLKWKADKRGFFEMRRHFATYFKSLPGFKDIRIKLVTSLDAEEIHQLLDSIVERYDGYES